MTERSPERGPAPRTKVRGMVKPPGESRLYHVWFSPKRNRWNDIEPRTSVRGELTLLVGADKHD